ncbi:MAG: hypothetical protein AB9842_08540 [Bacteroidales bacterium]
MILSLVHQARDKGQARKGSPAGKAHGNNCRMLQRNSQQWKSQVTTPERHGQKDPEREHPSVQAQVEGSNVDRNVPAFSK